MFRGKESSNGIELSWLVQELSNFGVFGFLRLLGVGGWVDVGGGWLRGSHNTHAHAHACMHTHARTCMHGKHGNFMQMAAPIGFGEIPGIPYDVICACVCVHVHMGGVHILTTSHPDLPTPPPPRGDPRYHSKFNSTKTNWDISILFEELKSVETPPLMGGCIIWWVGGWVGGLMGGVRTNH